MSPASCRRRPATWIDAELEAQDTGIRTDFPRPDHQQRPGEEHHEADELEPGRRHREPRPQRIPAEAQRHLARARRGHLVVGAEGEPLPAPKISLGYRRVRLRSSRADVQAPQHCQGHDQCRQNVVDLHPHGHLCSERWARQAVERLSAIPDRIRGFAYTLADGLASSAHSLKTERPKGGIRWASASVPQSRRNRLGIRRPSVRGRRTWAGGLCRYSNGG